MNDGGYCGGGSWQEEERWQRDTHESGHFFEADDSRSGNEETWIEATPEL
jgi:hypothetical protein